MREARIPKAPEEHIHLGITCLDCGEYFQKTAAWINVHDHVRCPACNEPIGLQKYKGDVLIAGLLDQLVTARATRKQRG